MKEEPLVSIIIPVYNRELVVKRALDAALAQTYTNIEVIACDNASTDGTWQTLQQYSARDNRVKIYRNSENVGPVKNWVECLKHVSGDYVKILWSDDYISPDYITKTLPILRDCPNVGFVYSKVKIIEAESENICFQLAGGTGVYDSEDFEKASIFNDMETPVSPGCALFRRKDVQKNLRIDIPNEFGLDFPRFGAGNDLLLFLYSCSEYPDFYYIDEVLSVFYGGRDSISESNYLYNYYMYAKIIYVKERGRQSLKNAFFSKIVLGPLSKMVKGEEYSINWRIIRKRVHRMILKIIGKKPGNFLDSSLTF